MTDFSELASRISGPVLTPADEGFGEEVAAHNLAIVHLPDVVVGAADAADVVEAVRFGREHGLPIRVQTTGHGALYPIRGGLLVTTKRLDGVVVDARGAHRDLRRRRRAGARSSPRPPNTASRRSRVRRRPSAPSATCSAAASGRSTAATASRPTTCGR